MQSSSPRKTLAPVFRGQPDPTSSPAVTVAVAPVPIGSDHGPILSSSEPPISSSGATSGAPPPAVPRGGKEVPPAEIDVPPIDPQVPVAAGESRESRSRSFAMAPPAHLQRKGSLGPDTLPFATKPESVVSRGEEGGPQKVASGPGEGTVAGTENGEAVDTSSEDDDVVEYIKDTFAESQGGVLSDDESRVAAVAEQEEGTTRLVSQSSFDTVGDEDAESTVALSSEDAFYEGQSHPRRKTASVDTTALVGRLNLSNVLSEPQRAHGIVKTGFLKKKSPKPSVGWQTRWFVLKDNRLMYFRRPEDAVPAGRIDLNLVKIKIQCLWDPHEFTCGLVGKMGSSVELPQVQARKWMELLCCGGGKTRLYATGRDPSDEVRCRVKPVGSTRAFELAGPYLELVDWIDKLSQVASECRVSSRHVTCVSQQKGFWKAERISPETFSQIAETGDVLLFRTKVLNAAVQRAITRGTYDHVALVLRGRDGRILILESMGDTGVIVTPWDLFTKSKWFTAYRKIVLRRLRWTRSAEKLDRLLTFVKNVVGKDYELTVAKLISRSKSDEEGGYFCSELVATAFQEIGALPANAVSSRFWPESFAARSNLKLCSGYELEEELLVDFSLLKHPGKRSRKDVRPQLKGRTLRSTVDTEKAKERESLEKPSTLTDVDVKAA